MGAHNIQDDDFKEESSSLGIAMSVLRDLQEEGYFNLKYVEGHGICGLYRFIYTTGLVLNIDHVGYSGRYCYGSSGDAVIALRGWDGKGDPEGPWIKYKGKGGERSRVPNEFD